MRQIGSFEAKTHLPKFLGDVSKGETIMITRKGEPIALLVPPEKKNKKNVKAVISHLREWRKGKVWGKGMSTKKAKKIGRK